MTEDSAQKVTSLDDYQERLAKSRIELRRYLEENFPNRYLAIEVGLSVKAQMKIEGITQPFTLIFMGAPSTHKSTILEILNSLPDCYRSDSFTPRSFVSHSTNTPKKKLKEIDLLPKIRYKTLITPELATLFAGKQEDLVNTFGMLTRILDGRGFISDTGAHGQRGYTGDYYFTWLGAVIDIPHRVWKLLGNLGPKIYFYRLPEDPKTQEEKLEQIKKTLKEYSYTERLDSSKEAINQFWEQIESRPDLENGKVIWDTQKDDEETVERIIKLAMVLGNLRATIPTWYTNESDSGGASYNFETPIKEDPSRASSVLYDLARGHALIYGRNFITKDDLKVVIPTALSSAPRERVDLFRLLIENNGFLNTEYFMEHAKVSRSTARKEMEKLSIMGLVDKTVEKATTKPLLAIKLKSEYNWFLTPEFNRYWNEFQHSLIPQNSKLSLDIDEDNLDKKGGWAKILVIFLSTRDECMFVTHKGFSLTLEEVKII